MSKDRIQELVASLREELHNASVDGDLRELMQSLEVEIEAAINPDDESAEPESVAERAEQLEARFASEHPVAEPLLREIIDLLTKMGV